MDLPPHQQVLDRIRAEYLEMPGMRLKIEQVQRLCGLERHICEAMLSAQVDARFLYVTSDGAYVRFTEDLHVRQRTAKAALPSLIPRVDSRKAS